MVNAGRERYACAWVTREWEETPIHQNRVRVLQFRALIHVWINVECALSFRTVVVVMILHKLRTTHNSEIVNAQVITFF